MIKYYSEDEHDLKHPKWLNNKLCDLNLLKLKCIAQYFSSDENVARLDDDLSHAILQFKIQNNVHGQALCLFSKAHVLFYKRDFFGIETTKPSCEKFK